MIVAFRKNGGLDTATQIELRVVQINAGYTSPGADYTRGSLGTISRTHFDKIGGDDGVTKHFGNCENRDQATPIAERLGIHLG